MTTMQTLNDPRATIGADDSAKVIKICEVLRELIICESPMVLVAFIMMLISI